MEKNTSFILTHLGESRADYEFAISPPIYQTSNFQFPDVAALRKAFSDEMDHHIYTRGNNPTVAILRKKLAALEHAEDALVFSSGISAIVAAVMGNIQQGDHIVSVRSVYNWARKLFDVYLPRFGVTTTYVDGKDVSEIEQSIQSNTRILYLESPTTMTFQHQDLEACARLAQQYQLLTIIDNSCASPIYQNPIDWGIDLVVHSGTKYLNGHSDVVCGVVCGTSNQIAKLFHSEYMNIGHIIGPFEAALILRGLRTLEVRMERIARSTERIISFLQGHPAIKTIHYPYAEDHPQYELAHKQMTGYGGLFAFEVLADSLADMERFVNALNYFLIAVSWGGHESLIIPICAFYDDENDRAQDLPWNYARVYVGLEDPDLLIKDLQQALSLISS